MIGTRPAVNAIKLVEVIDLGVNIARNPEKTYDTAGGKRRMNIRSCQISFNKVFIFEKS